VTIVLDVVEKIPDFLRSIFHFKSQIYTEVDVFAGYGFAGTYYFIDPTSGIAAVCCTQILPTLDPQVLKVWQEAEEALYAQ
jgi:hypothetical protein